MAEGVGVLSPSLADALGSVLSSIAGAEHVLVSNSFGLPIARVSAAGATVDAAPIESTFPILFAKAAEAADKLPLGKTRSATTVTSSFVLVQASLAPLVVAVVALPSADIPLLMRALPPLVALLEPLRIAAEVA